MDRIINVVILPGYLRVRENWTKSGNCDRSVKSGKMGVFLQHTGKSGKTSGYYFLLNVVFERTGWPTACSCVLTVQTCFAKLSVYCTC